MIITREFQKVLSKRLAEPAPLIQILLGARQVGKTIAAKAIYAEWQGAKLYASADMPTPPTADWIKWQWGKALEMGKGVLLIIDEVQKVPGWSEQIKELFDNERGRGNLKVLLLGSSSLKLKHGLGESLAGRFELVEAPHWTYREFNAAFGWDVDKYIKFGAYPGAADFADDEERWRDYILHSVIEPVIGRDILGFQSVHKPALFRQTFELAVGYPAQVISLQKMLGQLQDSGNVTTIKGYLDLFEQTFLIVNLQKFSGSTIQTKSSSPKLLILNHALTNCYHPVKRISDEPTWFGFVFETIIGAHLAQIPHSKLFYWRSGAAEVDYVLVRDGVIHAIEIKSGMKRKGKGLGKFYKQYPKAICETWDYNRCVSFLKDGVVDSPNI